jgi:hypothetical protein
MVGAKHHCLHSHNICKYASVHGLALLFVAVQMAVFDGLGGVWTFLKPSADQPGSDSHPFANRSFLPNMHPYPFIIDCDPVRNCSKGPRQTILG